MQKSLFCQFRHKLARNLCLKFFFALTIDMAECPERVTLTDNSVANDSVLDGQEKLSKQKSKTLVRSKVTKKVAKARTSKGKATLKMIQTSAKTLKQIETERNKSESGDVIQGNNGDLKSPVQLKAEGPRLVNCGSDEVEFESKVKSVAKPMGKRVAKLLENINENDILGKVRCDNKTKHTGSTSTPTFRRRPLKLPLEVSMIANQELE
jgi:hypothetical protein